MQWTERRKENNTMLKKTNALKILIHVTVRTFEQGYL